MASHSADGTEAKLTIPPYFWLRSVSHTQVSISYKVGYGFQFDTANGDSSLLTRVAFMVMSSSCRGVVARGDITRGAKKRADNNSLQGASSPLVSLVCWTRP